MCARRPTSLFVLAIVLVLLGGTSAAALPPGEPLIDYQPIGSFGRIGGLWVEVFDVDFNATERITAHGHRAPPEGTTYIVLDLIIINDGDTERSAQELTWSFVDEMTQERVEVHACTPRSGTFDVELGTTLNPGVPTLVHHCAALDETRVLDVMAVATLAADPINQCVFAFER
jgi:hypothetical protein